MSTERVLTTEVDTNVKSGLVEELFSRLPIAKDANLELLSPLIADGVSQEELRAKIENRFLDLINIRKRFGFTQIPQVNFGLALAILDDRLFTAVTEEVEETGAVLKTARHEIGHAAAAQLLGFKVTEVTVVPGAGYLGLTVAVPGSDFSPQEFLLKRAAISFAGAISAQMMKDPPLGSGSDMAQAQALASIALAYGLYYSEAAFLSEARSLAHSALRSFGESNIERQAHVLVYKQTFT